MASVEGVEWVGPAWGSFTAVLLSWLWHNWATSAGYSNVLIATGDDRCTCQITTALEVKGWVQTIDLYGVAMVWRCNGSMPNWWPQSCWFDSRSVHCQATTLGKLFTPMCLCSPGSLIWYRL